MTARIIPFMKRRTCDEWRYRQNCLLSLWWEAALTPARIWMGLWR